MDHLWLVLKTTDWITAICFFFGGIFAGFRMRRLTVAADPAEMASINQILAALKRKARIFYGRQRVNLADIQEMIQRWQP